MDVGLTTLAVAILCISTADAQISNVTAGPNPLLVSNLRFPLWDQIKPEHIEPAIQQVLAEESASFSLLEQDLTRALKVNNVTFSKVFRPLTQIQLRLDSVTGQVGLLSSVKDSEPVRKAVEATTPLQVAFTLRIGQSKPVYDAVLYLNNTPAVANTLSPEQRRLVEITLRDAVDSGVWLPAEQRKRFNEIVDTLQKLSLTYSNNVLDATKAWQLVIKDKKQLDGVEQTTLAVAAQKAQKAGYKNATTENGPWLLTPDYATYSAIMKSAKNRKLREQLYTAYRSLASTGKHDNTPVIKKLLTLRRELAKILGYENYAESAMKNKMANLTSAFSLLEQVANASKPAAIREEQQLTAFARNATGDPKLKLLWWDTTFWGERQKEALFRVSQEELRPYLPLNAVQQGMFELAHNLYGIDVVAVKERPPVWHKDVQVYVVKENSTAEVIGYLYTDLFARPGQKEGGAWVQPFWDAAHYRRAPSPAAQAMQAAAGNKPGKTGNVTVKWTPELARQTSDWLTSAPKQVPLAILVTNQDPPVGKEPSLMTLDDAETLFHEFGHALQHLLTKANEGLMTGMRNIEWDAVEVPSQMQEKWVYDKNTFNSLSRHYKTGQPVPDWMYEQIKQTVKYRAGNSFAWQLVLGLTDLILHSSYDPEGMKAPIEVQHEQFRRIMPYPPNPQDAQLNNFGHIFGGGYAAGYYSYMWADVMSADSYEAFVEAGTTDKEATSKLGRRFRNTFLASGGAVPPAKVFKDFRGREPSVESMLIYKGLA